MYVTLVHFTICNIKYSHKKIKNVVLELMFIFFMEHKNVNKNVFHVFGHLVICLWKSLELLLKEVAGPC